MPRACCPSCSADLRAPARLAGRFMNCPECGGRVRVPASEPDSNKGAAAPVLSAVRRVPAVVWLVAAPVALVAVCCGGLVAFAPRPSAELRKADQMHAAGKRGEAVAVYKQYPSELLRDDGAAVD